MRTSCRASRAATPSWPRTRRATPLGRATFSRHLGQRTWNLRWGEVAGNIDDVHSLSGLEKPMVQVASRHSNSLFMYFSIWTVPVRSLRCRRADWSLPQPDAVLHSGAVRDDETDKDGKRPKKKLRHLKNTIWVTEARGATATREWGSQ